MAKPESRSVTTAELARRWGCSARMVRSLVVQGLPARKVDGVWRCDLAAAEAWRHATKSESGHGGTRPGAGRKGSGRARASTSAPPRSPRSSRRTSSSSAPAAGGAGSTTAGAGSRSGSRTSGRSRPANSSAASSTVCAISPATTDPPDPPDPPAAPTVEGKTRAEWQLEELAEGVRMRRMERLRREGDLVERAAVERDYAALAAGLRRRLERLPREAAAALARELSLAGPETARARGVLARLVSAVTVELRGNK